ncbi:MAG: DUF3833 family protein [Pseudomonadota bacterium]
MSLPTFLGLLLLVVAQGAPPAGPEHFFVGRTEGTGSVQIMLSGKHKISDRSTGRIDAGGVLVLEQLVDEEGKPARKRSWRLSRSAPDRITGTISDARGAVTGEIKGKVLYLRYRSTEGPWVEQSITLNPDGRTATNRMTFTRLGIQVATLVSTIRRLD